MRDQSEEPSESGTSGVNILTKNAGNSRRRHACPPGMFQPIMIPRIATNPR